ncbi:MAG: DUF2309 domain-containing protein [Saprospiraceae bacterium]|nr:DUF2309 domain-containing protein [Saprospiraceae bacterium]
MVRDALTPKGVFSEVDTLHKLKHFLPSQAPLKDFIHHNTLHAFQDSDFFEGIQMASSVFGYKVTFSLEEYRNMFKEGRINEDVIDQVLQRENVNDVDFWKNAMINGNYKFELSQRIGEIRSFWKKSYRIDLDLEIHPVLFRILCSYLDQGIAIRHFPNTEKGFIDSVREIEKNGLVSIFKTERARNLLLDEETTIADLLKILVGDERWYEHYLFDQQFAHPGWSGLVSKVEESPETLLSYKKIRLRGLILFELLLEIDALDNKFGPIWAPLVHHLPEGKQHLFEKIEITEIQEILRLWQLSFEWSYFDQVLGGLNYLKRVSENRPDLSSFQALFCIDDRECSLRRYVEQLDQHSRTYGTAGFFNVEFYYKPEGGKFHTKVCPAPLFPKYLVKEISQRVNSKKDVHFTKHSHSFLWGWIISQTLGFWSALRLAANILKPSVSPATSLSFRHMDEEADLYYEYDESNPIEDNLQLGFKPVEMADRVEGLLKSIGLTYNFAPLVYVVGHGSTSVNNTHYAGYDCGACSGRPGSVNARVFSKMANHKVVRNLLAERGLNIPETTLFIGALHDTSRDEIVFYDEELLTQTQVLLHKKNKLTFQTALHLNAKERSRRFELINTKQSPAQIHEKVKRRSVSLFEPRPELNHATNCLCIVGRRSLTRGLFLDRRAFMNSYDYRIDPDGKYLTNILNAVAPVCGGINLEYYFSRMDNLRLGAGTKLAHNVMGLFGVANGIDGDLRPGLPEQMIEIHDPMRLLVIVEQKPEIVNSVLKANPVTQQWFFNKWIFMVVVDPESGIQYLYYQGKFEVYESLYTKPLVSNNLTALTESSENSFPVYLLKEEL